MTRSKTTSESITDQGLGQRIIAELVKKTAIGQRKIRLLGVSFSSLESPIATPRPKQLDLFQFN